MKCHACDALAIGRLVTQDGSAFEDCESIAVCERCARDPEYDDCILLPFPAATENHDSTES